MDSTPPPVSSPFVGGYASTGSRVAAFLVDLVATSVIQTVLNNTFDLYDRVPGRGGVTVTGNLDTLMVWLVVWSIWFVVPTAITGATLGKAFLGIRVTTLAGGTPGLAKAALRYLGISVMAALCWIPLILTAANMGSRPRHQGWHDRLADTIVVTSR